MRAERRGFRLGRPAALFEALLDRRDGLVADPRFRSWAARFPLTRFIARRRAAALFDLCAGFVYAQILQACVELGLFAALADGPQTGQALARRLDLPLAGVERLLAAAAALRLVATRQGGRFGLGPLGAAMVGNDGVAAMVRHHRTLYADLADPVALLRGQATASALAGFWPYAAADFPDGLAPPQVAGYSALMAASQPLIAAEILDAYGIARHRAVLDLGGGDGAFLAAAASRAPGLTLALFDLPAVIERAAARFAAAERAGQIRLFGGDFLRDTLPAGADLVTLIRVVHDHDDSAAATLLRAVRRALPPGGTLLLAEPMAGTDRAAPMGDAYFGFYLLAMGKGRPRRAERLTAMLHEAGFDRVRELRTNTPLLVRVLVARVGTPPESVQQR